MDPIRLNDKGLLNSYKFTSKTHSTMSKKYFIPLYAEHIHFLIKRCDWLVTKIYAHYTFEQSKFKKELVIINQVPGRNSETSVEKDFYELMKNSNFGYSCSNNVDNCFFDPVYDESNEINYIKNIKVYLAMKYLTLSLVNLWSRKLHVNSIIL